MSVAALIAVSALLAGCDDGKERAAFEAACIGAEFSPKQCAFMYAMKKDADDTATANAVTSGVALGMAATSGGRR